MRYSKIQYICWLFSGAEISLLKECPTDFNRQASIGFTIFMTCLLAGLSGGFAAWRFTIDTPGQDGNWIASIIFGLVWGMLVFSIDRSMVVTLKKDPTLKSQPFLIPLVTRMILAGLLAFMISIPLETKIFEPEIAKQAKDDIQKAKQNYGGSVETTSGIGAVEKRKQESAEEARLANERAGFENARIPGVAELIAEVEAQERLEQRLRSEAQSQLIVVRKAQDKRYRGPDPRTGLPVGGFFTKRGPDWENHRRAIIKLNGLKQQADAAGIAASTKRTEANKIATAYRAKAAKDGENATTKNGAAEIERGRRQHEIDSIKIAYDKQLQKRGFVSEFVSMENAASQKENGSMLFFLWFIRILFFVIEILPTIVKLATPVGEYDHQLYAHEQMFALALRTNYKILEDREVVRQQTELNITNQLEQARQDKEIELGQKMLEQTANIQNSLAKQMLNDWHKAEKEKQRLATTPLTPKTATQGPSPGYTATPVVAELSVVKINSSLPSPGDSAQNQPLTVPVAASQNINSRQEASINHGTHSSLISELSIPGTSQTAHGTNIVTPAALTEVNMWHLDNKLERGFYRFKNGFATNNQVQRKIGFNQLEQGVWEHPQGDKGRLRMSFGGIEQEYDIQRLTNTEMCLKNAGTDEVLIFQA